MSEQKSGSKPGHMLIRGGVILAVLGVVLFAMTAGAGQSNPGMLFGALVVGLLLVIVGYVKRGSNR
ncbi:hypothetical protein QEH68_06750 [Paenarthrobacter sp. OM7]|uniref:hypothetical protein n=1 Tax=Paenarthrobacter sp. OM7 TaxID=3041264 RepID=UPI00246931FD|nr:hypothetical protein [Paenarthrobacter sp. OM7]WGM21867.1 hypothetical protein QEH68_06750 [Paenarthrobacter sp. OM7]